MDMHEDVAFDPGIGAIQIDPIILGASENISNEMHDRAPTLAARKIHHVVVANRDAKKVARKHSMAAGLDSPGAMDQLEACGGGWEDAFPHNKRGPIQR